MIQLSRAVLAARKRRKIQMLARLEFALRLSEEDILGGLERLEALSHETVEAAGELALAAAREASDAAVEGFLRPLVDAGRGGVEFPDGWDERLGVSLDLHIRHAQERIEEARAIWINELRRDLEAWDDEGLLADDVEAMLLLGLRGTLGKDGGFRYENRAYATFRAAIRRAVMEIVGRAGTETEHAGLKAMRVDRSMIITQEQWDARDAA